MNVERDPSNIHRIGYCPFETGIPAPLDPNARKIYSCLEHGCSVLMFPQNPFKGANTTNITSAIGRCAKRSFTDGKVDEVKLRYRGPGEALYPNHQQTEELPHFDKSD